MSHRIKRLSLNRRRNRLDEIETTEATAYFADITAELAAHRDEPLGADANELDAEPWTAEPEQPTADPDAETQQIPVVPTPLPDIRQRLIPVPVDPRSWVEQDVIDQADRIAQRVAELAADYATQLGIAEPIEQLPVPRRRHLPAVGTWFADRLRPVPLPAIPDADRFQTAPLPGARPSDLLPQWSAQAQQSARFVLEAAASTEAARPDDFVEWLRQEFAGTYELCDAALVEHSVTAQADLAALEAGYFQDIDIELDRLNAMTLPGWTNLENELLKTGIYA